MRILIATNHVIGLYKFRREVVEALTEKHEVYLSLPNGNYMDYFVQLGCKFCACEFDRHGTNPIKELKQIWYYRKLLREICPDIVFTYTIKPNVYCGSVCAQLGIPYVVNITGLGMAVETGGLMQKITLALYRFGLRKAQKVFFQNSENRDFMLKRRIIKTPYDLLPGSGVNLKQYQVLPYPETKTVDFLFVSRIMKEKGIDQYLDAAEEIRKRHPETRFHICGFCEQDYQSKLDFLEQKGVIIYHGLVDDMIQLYRITSCTVHPTYYSEGLSNVLLESAASGRPIITTDRAGCREVVEDGLNGFLVRERDSVELIKKLEKFLALSPEERKSMGLSGREKVEREFSRQVVIDKYLAEVQRAEEKQLEGIYGE